MVDFRILSEHLLLSWGEVRRRVLHWSRWWWRRLPDRARRICWKEWCQSGRKVEDIKPTRSLHTLPLWIICSVEDYHQRNSCEESRFTHDINATIGSVYIISGLARTFVTMFCMLKSSLSNLHQYLSSPVSSLLFAAFSLRRTGEYVSGSVMTKSMKRRTEKTRRSQNTGRKP